MKNPWIDKLRGQRVIFYLFVGYIFLFLFWWCYLLYTKISHLAEEKFRYLELLSQIDSDENYLMKIDLIQTSMNREHIMIIAEGITFFIILLIVAFRLRKAFNKELQIARQQKNFMLSITHELKSPIASASLNLETLQKRELDEQKRNLLLSNSTREINRLNELVNKILLAAKMESDFFSAEFEQLNLSQICEEIVQNFLTVEENKDRLNLINIQQDVHLNGDKTLLKSLFLNLIDNALKYSESTYPVEVSLTANNQQILFKVADQGKGISEEDKKYIFEKFYRVGNEETRTHTGTGLGLYLVYQIVQIHRGRINIWNNPSGKGTVFEVELTLA